MAFHDGREAAEADVLRHGGQEHHRVLAQGSGGADDQAQKVDEAEAVWPGKQKMMDSSKLCCSCVYRIVMNKCFTSAYGINEVT